MFVFIANKKTEVKPAVKSVNKNDKKSSQASVPNSNTTKKASNGQKVTPKEDKTSQAKKNNEALEANKPIKSAGDQENKEMEEIDQNDDIKALEKKERIMNLVSLIRKTTELHPKSNFIKNLTGKVTLQLDWKGKKYEIIAEIPHSELIDQFLNISNKNKSSPEDQIIQQQYKEMLKALSQLMKQIKNLVSTLVLKDEIFSKIQSSSSPLFYFSFKEFSEIISCLMSEKEVEHYYQNFPMFRFTTIKIEPKKQEFDDERIISLHTAETLVIPEEIGVNEIILFNIFSKINKKAMQLVYQMNTNPVDAIVYLGKLDTPKTLELSEKTKLIVTNESQLQKLPESYFKKMILPAIIFNKMVHNIMKNVKISGIKETDANTFAKDIALILTGEFYGLFLNEMGEMFNNPDIFEQTKKQT